MELGFLIPIVSGIPDSLGCTLDSKLRIPSQAKISRIRDPKSKNLSDSEIRISFYMGRYQLVQYIGRKSESMNLMHLFSERD